MQKTDKAFLDSLVEKFETTGFIKDDPVQFPHRFEKKQDIEISGFISSAFAYGNRKKIVENLEFIHKILGNSPYEFVINFNPERDIELFKGFVYRYTGEKDILYLLYVLSETFKKFDSLEDAFLQGFSPEDKNIKNGLINFVNLLRGYLPYGEKLKHLVPSPENGSACKRLNLFLKWMVRKGPVDLHIWQGMSYTKTFRTGKARSSSFCVTPASQKLPADKLVIPLDVHVGRVSTFWGFSGRKSNDWKKAEEITENLIKIDPDDPVKYDFAIFGAGITGLYNK